MRKKRNVIKISLLTVFLFLVCILIVALAMFQGVLRTVASVEKQSDYPVYTIDYKADYGLDKLLENGASTDDEVVQFLINHLLKGLPINVEYEIPDLDLGCSTFQAINYDDEVIFGRNFDNVYSPAGITYTNPKNGYASISLVSLSFLGYSEHSLPDKLLDRLNILALPFFPLDGLNEKGVSIGVLQIDSAPTKQETGKIDITTTLAIRMILDKAANVDEAIEILSSFDMQSSANGCYHFHIADSAGKSVVVEYIEDEMVLFEVDTAYQACTNFFLTEVDFEYKESGKERLEIMETGLESRSGVITEEEAMDLLSEVSADSVFINGVAYPTQWSSLYNNERGYLKIVFGRDYDNVYKFDIKK